MKRWVSVFLVLTLVLPLVLCACGGDEQVIVCSAYTSTLLSAEGVEAPAIQPSCSDAQKLAADHFAAALLRNTAADGENTLVSPLSVLAALAMTANGARGETLAQMEQMFGMSVEDLCAFLQVYLDSGEELSVADAIWIRDDYTEKVSPDFLAKNTQWLNSSTFSAPFDDDTCTDINNWVADHTKQRIPQILDQIDPRAVMYLVNALTFDGTWADPFLEWSTYDEDFTNANGQTVQVPTMHGTADVYLADEQATGFVRYYQEGRYAFVALLPNSDISLSEYVAGLQGDHIKALLDNRQSIEVRLSMPRFQVSYGKELKEPLTAMGMEDAFTNRADLSGIAGKPGDLNISRVLHKTFMKVDEAGVEAAAATVVAPTEACAMIDELQYRTVYLTRPFVYMVIDTQQELPLFIGTLADMEAARPQAG